MVCLSLFQAGSLEAGEEVYDLADLDNQTCVRRFSGLMQSHVQHARMLNALYRQARRAKASRKHGAMEDSFAGYPSGHTPLAEDSLVMAPDLRISGAASSPRRKRSSAASMNMSNSFDMSGTMNMSQRSSPGDISRLQQEIATTTSEANARIEQAAQAITTLQERVQRKKDDNEIMRKEIADMEHEAEELELNNERQKLQNERRGRERAASAGIKPGQEVEEVARLKQEVQYLTEQKAALMLILEDLYGATGQKKDAQEGPDEPAPTLLVEPQHEPQPVAALPSSPSGARLLAAPPPEEPDKGWTNMLPRPSELLREIEAEDECWS